MPTVGTTSIRLVPVLVAIPLLAACGGNAADMSTECMDAFAVAADTPDGMDAQEALDATLQACEGYDEWVQALRDEPAAMGRETGAMLEGPMELAGVCRDADGPVCDDARQRGIIPGAPAG